MRRLLETGQQAWASFRENFRGWMICLAVLVVTVVRSGITYSFGVFVVDLVTQYHTPISEQNWIGTLSFTISLTFAPLSVTLIRCFRENGYRIVSMLGVMVLNISCIATSLVQSPSVLFFTHSFLYGVGSSFIYMASSLKRYGKVISEYFDTEHKNHVLATSILLCGYPIGSLVFNPINSYIVERFGWRMAFRISSALIFVIGMGCCWTFKRNPEIVRREQEARNAAAQDETFAGPEESASCPTIPLKEMTKRHQIWIWLLISLFTYLGFYMPFMNLEYYMSLKGIGQTQSSLALFLLSLAECCSYIGASFLGDYCKGRLIYCNLLASLALGIILVMWPKVDDSYNSILAISMAMGFFLGLTIVYTYAESSEVTGLPLHIGWAYTNMASGIGILFSPLASGFIYDLRKNYDDVFYTVGALYAITSLLCIAVIMLSKLQWRRQQEQQMCNMQQTSTVIITPEQMAAEEQAKYDQSNALLHSTAEQPDFNQYQQFNGPPELVDCNGYSYSQDSDYGQSSQRVPVVQKVR